MVIPEQLPWLQVAVSIFSPLQFAPPNLGLGLSHVLFVLCVPLPHDTEHADQSDQSDQPPSTEKYMHNLIYL